MIIIYFETSQHIPLESGAAGLGVEKEVVVGLKVVENFVVVVVVVGQVTSWKALPWALLVDTDMKSAALLSVSTHLPCFVKTDKITIIINVWMVKGC